MHISQMQSALSILCLTMMSMFAAAFADEPCAESRFTHLFNEGSLDDCSGAPRSLRVKDGVTIRETAKDLTPEQTTFLIHRGGGFSDIEPRLSHQVEGFRSRVQNRSVDQGNWVTTGRQRDSEDRWQKSKQNPDASPVDKQNSKSVEDRSPQGLPDVASKHSVTKTLPVGKVTLTEDALDETAGALPAFKITTPTATYFLEKSGGGLSSLVDQDGRDWIGFHPEKGSGAGGEYRGFPNAVFRQGGSYFHAMNAKTDSLEAQVEQVKEGYVSIIAESPNGEWQGRYEFFASHCSFTITKMPKDKNYWVLYEGTPGGELDLDDWWMTSSIKTPQPISKPHQGDIPSPEWIAFGDAGGDRSIVLLNHKDDDYPDSYYQMDDKMTVFGFGREKLNVFHSKVGQRFSIGLVESVSHADLATYANRILRDSKTDQTASAGQALLPVATQHEKPTGQSVRPACFEPLSIDIWFGPHQRLGRNGNQGLMIGM